MVETNTKVNKQEGKKISLVYILAFVAGIFSLSKFFNAYHYFEEGNDLLGVLVMTASIGVFVLSIGYMTYKIYVEEKARGNLRKSIFFFDWLELKIQTFKDMRKKEIEVNG